MTRMYNGVAYGSTEKVNGVNFTPVKQRPPATECPLSKPADATEPYKSGTITDSFFKSVIDSQAAWVDAYCSFWGINSSSSPKIT